MPRSSPTASLVYDPAVLTTGPVPCPVVAVIGDQSDSRTGDFASAVRRGVQEAHDIESGRRSRATQPTDVGHDLDQLAKREKLFKWKRRRIQRIPMPVFIQDGGDAENQQFQRSVFSLLANTDVWGIIAAGNAKNTETVRVMLDGVDLPLLITTDSTAKTTAASKLTKELRLVPTNDVQAESIIANCIEEGFPRGRHVGVLLDPGQNAGAYVRDLNDALAIAASRRSVELISRRAEITQHMQVIVIGYVDYALKLLETRIIGSRFICTDGCYGKKLAETIRKEKIGDWYWTKPDVKFEELGASAFSAVVAAGKSLLNLQPKDERRIREVPFIELVRVELEKHPDFAFVGGRNVRPRYSVEEIT